MKTPKGYVNWEVLVPFLLAALLVLVMLLTQTGCSNLPSMQYCDTVWYSREGQKIHLEADCRAPIGSMAPGGL